MSRCNYGKDYNMKGMAVLDADVIAYMSTAGAEEEPDVWGEGHTKSQFEVACERADNMIEGWLEVAECTTPILAFSGPSATNFRRGVHPQYKHNRTGEKPEYYVEVVDYMLESYVFTEQYPVLEGDDILGMFMERGVPSVSTDKDLRTVPGKFMRIKYDGSVDRYNSSLDEANHFWMWQTLTGDTVDGYRGCPGCGTKGATQCLPGVGARLDQLWHAVVQRYQDAWRKPKQREKFITGHPEDEALMNARAARILRSWDEYDVDSEEVKLWRP